MEYLGFDISGLDHNREQAAKKILHTLNTAAEQAVSFLQHDNQVQCHAASEIENKVFNDEFLKRLNNITKRMYKTETQKEQG